MHVLYYMLLHIYVRLCYFERLTFTAASLLQIIWIWATTRRIIMTSEIKPNELFYRLFRGKKKTNEATERGYHNMYGGN